LTFQLRKETSGIRTIEKTIKPFRMICVQSCVRRGIAGTQPTMGHLNFSKYPCEADCRNLETKTEQLNPILMGTINLGWPFGGF
jgi:hypothetical protein